MLESFGGLVEIVWSVEGIRRCMPETVAVAVGEVCIGFVPPAGVDSEPEPGTDIHSHLAPHSFALGTAAAVVAGIGTDCCRDTKAQELVPLVILAQNSRTPAWVEGKSADAVVRSLAAAASSV